MLKTELLPRSGAFASLEEALLKIAYYLDTYFNLARHHSPLDYRSPHQFETVLYTLDLILLSAHVRPSPIGSTRKVVSASTFCKRLLRAHSAQGIGTRMCARYALFPALCPLGGGRT